MDIEHTEYLEGIMLEYLSVMPFCSPINMCLCTMLL